MNNNALERDVTLSRAVNCDANLDFSFDEGKYWFCVYGKKGSKTFQVDFPCLNDVEVLSIRDKFNEVLGSTTKGEMEKTCDLLGVDLKTLRNISLDKVAKLDEDSHNYDYTSEKYKTVTEEKMVLIENIKHLERIIQEKE